MFSFLKVREWLTQKKKYDMLLLPIFLVGIALLLVDCYKATLEIVPRDLACWDSRGCEIRWALASADSGDAVCPRRRLGRVNRPHVFRDIVWNKGRESTVPYTTDTTDSSDSSDLDFFSLQVHCFPEEWALRVQFKPLSHSLPEDVRTLNLQKNEARPGLFYSIKLAITLSREHLLSIYYMEAMR